MHHSQVRHRRTNSALTAGLGILAEKYRLLSTECLRTLRVEIQLNAIYHLQVSISTELFWSGWSAPIYFLYEFTARIVTVLVK